MGKSLIPAGPVKMTWEFSDGTSFVWEFRDILELDVEHEIVEKQSFLPKMFVEIEHSGMVNVKLRGKLASAPPEHEHHWMVTTEKNVAHYPLQCECGATACGNVFKGINGLKSMIHNVREPKSVQNG